MAFEQALVSLGQWLSENDFEATPAQLAAAGQLLRRHRLSLDAADAEVSAKLLRPVFAKNVDQQRRFQGLVFAWMGLEPKPDPESTKAPSGELIEVEEKLPGRWRAAALFLLLVLSVLVLRVLGQEHFLVFATQGIGNQPAQGVEVEIGPCRKRTDARGEARCSVRWLEIPRTATGRLGDQIASSQINPWPRLLALNTTVEKLRLNFAELPSGPNRTLYDGRVRLEISGAIALAPPPFGPPENELHNLQIRDRLFTATVIFALLFWIFLAWIRRGARLSRGLRQVANDDEVLKGIAPAAKLGVARDMRRAAGAMRNLVSVESACLNVRATAWATIRAGGFFQPVFTSRRERRYIILIERLSLQDHHAWVGRELADQCRKAGADIQVFHFGRDPVVLDQVLLDGRPSMHGRRKRIRPRLDMLLTDQRDTEFILICDPRAMVDSFRPELNAWVRRIRDESAVCTLLTMMPLSHSGRARSILMNTGVSCIDVRPGTLTALAEFSRWPNSRLSAAHSCPDASKAAFIYPPAALSLAAQVPNAETVRRFLEELQGYLGNDGYQWLQACAIYPDIKPAVTNAVGVFLVPDERRETSFLKLAGLVWFRTGYMPDWLRLALVADISDASMSELRRFYWTLFASSTRGEHFALSLSNDDLKQRLVTWLRRMKIMLFTEHALVLRDRVFIRFLLGQRPSALDMPVFQKILRRLKGAGRSTFFFAATTAAILATSVAVLLLPNQISDSKLMSRDFDIAVRSEPPKVVFALGSGGALMSVNPPNFGPNWGAYGEIPPLDVDIIDAKIATGAEILGLVDSGGGTTFLRTDPATTLPRFVWQARGTSGRSEIAFSPAGTYAISVQGFQAAVVGMNPVTPRGQLEQGKLASRFSSFQIPQPTDVSGILAGVNDVGNFAVIGNADTLRTFELPGGSVLETVLAPRRPLRVALALHPGSDKKFSECFSGGLVQTWSGEGSVLLPIYRNQFDSCSALAVHPRGDFLVVGGSNGQVRIVSIGSPVVSPPLGVPYVGNAPVRRIAFSADGQYMVVLRNDRSISLVQLRMYDIEGPTGGPDHLSEADAGRPVSVSPPASTTGVTPPSIPPKRASSLQDSPPPHIDEPDPATNPAGGERIASEPTASDSTTCPEGFQFEPQAGLCVQSLPSKTIKGLPSSGGPPSSR